MQSRSGILLRLRRHATTRWARASVSVECSVAEHVGRLGARAPIDVRMRRGMLAWLVCRVRVLLIGTKAAALCCSQSLR
jgi:hypothetical protein